jgi:hypothetical protein
MPVIPFPASRRQSHLSRLPAGECPPDASVMLRRAIRGTGNQHHLLRIFHQKPALYQNMLCLAYHITDVLPVSHNEEESLLARCLKNGMHAWDVALSTRVRVNARYRDFLRGCLESVPSILNWVVYVENEGDLQAWDQATPLSEWWLKKRQAPALHWRNPEYDSTAQRILKKDVRSVIAGQILDMLDIDSLQEEGGVDSIVC